MDVKTLSFRVSPCSFLLESRNLVEIDTRYAVLDLVKSATGHTEVSALINMGQVEPKQGREKRL